MVNEQYSYGRYGIFYGKARVDLEEVVKVQLKFSEVRLWIYIVFTDGQFCTIKTKKEQKS